MYFNAFDTIFFNLFTRTLYLAVAVKMKFLLKFRFSSIIFDTIYNICSSVISANSSPSLLTYSKNWSIVSCIKEPVLKV